MDINPLELATDNRTGNKLDFFNNIYKGSDTLKQIFELGDIQHPILKEAIKEFITKKDLLKLTEIHGIINLLNFIRYGRFFN